MNFEDVKKRVNDQIGFHKDYPGGTSMGLGREYVSHENSCTRGTVFAGILDTDGRILAYHFNTQINFSCTGEIEKCGCVHAEILLLTGLVHITNLNGRYIIVSTLPCPTCAAVICSFISRIGLDKFKGTLYIEDCDRYSRTKEIFAISKIPLIKI